MRPGWITAWWRAFGGGEPLVVTARRGGVLTGLLPLERRGGVLRAPANYHTPVFEPLAADADSLRALADRALAERPAHLDLFMLEGDDAVRGGFSAAAAQAGFGTLERVVVRTPYRRVEGDWEPVLAGRSRKVRKELRRNRRGLEAMGPVELEEIRDHAGLERAFGDFLALESSGWKAESGTAISSTLVLRDFYEAVTEWAADAGYLMLFFLRVGERRIAADLCLDDRGRRYMLKGGFDREYSKHSPGTVLLEADMAQGYAAGLERIELGGGSDQYKLRWAQETTSRWQFEAFSPSIAGRARHTWRARVLPLARRVRDRRRGAES